MNDDAALLEAWRNGDDDAGSRLFRRHFKGVYRFFRSKLAEQADDLTQDTFQALLQADPSAQVQSVRAYLYMIARNKLYEVLRRRERHGEWDPLTHSVADLGGSPTRELARRQEHTLLLQALERLPLELQLLLELYYFEHMRGPELACVLELPEGTVRSRLRRALALLRTAMTELSEDASLVKSTVDDIERWAEQLRGRPVESDR